MKKHTRIYCRFFGIGEQDHPLCEMPNCNRRIVDVHHIHERGMGGDPLGVRDKIRNLMGLCRKHHDEAGNGTLTKEVLQKIHDIYIKTFEFLNSFI